MIHLVVEILGATNTASIKNRVSEQCPGDTSGVHRAGEWGAVNRYSQDVPREFSMYMHAYYIYI